MEFTHKIKETIVPSPASPVHMVALSNNDQIMPPFYTSFLYFFAAPSSPPQTLPFKLSLARTLAAFPVVSGRLKPRSSGNGARVNVDCSNQGAVFVEAQTSTTLQTLLTTGKGDVRGSGMYQPNPLWKLLAPDPYEESTDKPLLFTQLTRLGCGGVVVAVLLHHLVADGAGQAHFVASWGDLARGEAIAALPHLDRACMSARIPPCPSFEHHEYSIITVHSQPPPSSPAPANDLPPPMTSRIFEFLPQDMQVLKDRANAESGGDVYTGFQALVAHIWKHITKARGTERSQEIKLGWAVDGRKRFNPPLPPHYFGNVNFYGCSAATAGEVMDEAVGSTAGRIQVGIQRVTDEYMRSALDFIEAQEERVAVVASFVRPDDLAVTSWQQFPAYDADWGWGRPVFFAPAVYAFTGLVILLPHPLRGVAVNALVGMPLPHMHALLSDPHFYPVTPP